MKYTGNLVITKANLHQYINVNEVVGCLDILDQNIILACLHSVSEKITIHLGCKLIAPRLVNVQDVSIFRHGVLDADLLQVIKGNLYISRDDQLITSSVTAITEVVSYPLSFLLNSDNVSEQHLIRNISNTN